MKSISQMPAFKPLLARIDAHAWSTELSRRVQHYGYAYDYKAREVTQSSYLGPLPDWLGALAGELVSDGHFRQPPDQVFINEYLPGQGIAPIHKSRHSGT